MGIYDLVKLLADGDVDYVLVNGPQQNPAPPASQLQSGPKR